LFIFQSSSGVARNFLRGGILKFFVWENLGGDFQFFFKNPSKLKNFLVKGRGTNPPIPPGYAPAELQWRSQNFVMDKKNSVQKP